MRVPFVVSVVAVLTVGVLAWAENWAEFRGPTGQGHAQGALPVDWSPDKNVAWKQDIPGKGWSSPVLWDGKVYLTTAVPDAATKELSLRVLCLDAATGKVLWNVEAIKQPASKVPNHHNKNSNASPSPLVDGKHLYVHFGHLGTACLDLTGKLVWKNTELSYTPVHGNGGSPILADDLLVFSIDGSNKQALIALDRGTGKLRWQTDRRSTAPKKFSFSTPLLIEVAGQKQIISPASNMVGGYDAKTGAEVWRVNYTGYSVIPRPVYGHGLVFLSTSYDRPTFLAIKPDGKGDVTESHVAWSTKKDAPHTPSALLVGDELYLVSDNGTATCLDAKSGTVHWSQRLGRNGFSASPTFADGKVYFQDEEGVGYVVKAGKQYELLAKNDMKEKTLASYAVADGAIYLRTGERLYKIAK